MDWAALPSGSPTRSQLRKPSPASPALVPGVWWRGLPPHKGPASWGWCQRTAHPSAGPAPHSLKLGSSSFPRGDLGPVERSVGRLRTMHSKMLLDIEKVQIHFGGSVKASSQMIHELLQAQCLSSPCYRRWASPLGPRAWQCVCVCVCVEWGLHVGDSM